MGGRALILVNPRASRAGEGLVRAFERLEAADVAVQIREPRSPEAAEACIRDADADRIVVAGGDGSLHRVLPFLLERGLPLGILPAGTANDFARSLGVPLDLPGAAEVVAGGRLRSVDLGRVNGHLFLNVASFGISTRITRELDGETKRRWGVLSYALHGARAVRASRPFHATLRWEGGERRMRALQVGVANGRHYGGGMTVDAGKQPDDGLLAVFAIEPQGPLGLAKLIPRLWLGRLRGAARASIEPTRSLSIETSRPFEIDADGELVAHTPAHFDLVPKALHVLVPAGPGNDRA